MGPHYFASPDSDISHGLSKLTITSANIVKLVLATAQINYRHLRYKINRIKAHCVAIWLEATEPRSSVYQHLSGEGGGRQEWAHLQRPSGLLPLHMPTTPATTSITNKQFPHVCIIGR